MKNEKKGKTNEGATVHVNLVNRSFTFLAPMTENNMDPGKAHSKQFTTVYLDVKTGTYRVQPYVKGPVSWTEFGEPTVLAREEFCSRIATSVLDALDRFNKDIFDPALAPRRSAAEQRASIKQNLSVFVARLETDEIEVIPQRREPGGYTGDIENSTLLKPEEIAQRLADAIQEAFSKAT